MTFKERIGALLSDHGIDPSLLAIPPDAAMGEYALPCFQLAKAAGKSPVALAAELASKLHAPFLASVTALGPYVNFRIKPDALATEVISAVTASGAQYGAQAQKHERVMVEYSQPNTHKAFHVGHLRGTSLGEALSRILKHAGFEVIQANYSGDTGAHIAKWLWYYTTRHQTPPPSDPHERERWIADIYVKAIQTLTENPEHQQEVDEILRKLDVREAGELMAIYERTRQWSIDAFWTIYHDLHAHFDHWFFESEVEEPGKRISKELLAQGIAKIDDGALIVDLEDKKLGIWVLLRKDGTALYSAKDLALAERKFGEFKIDRSLYAIGAAQSQHMQQLFETLRRMGFTQADKCYHLSFNEVRLPTGKMSSRTGQNLLYSDIRAEVGDYARVEIKRRHEDWSTERVEQSARQIIIGALKWDMLATDPNKAIVFDPKLATEFEGDTGPYVQYTHARACSILAKAGDAPSGSGASLTHPKEQALLKEILAFPEAIERAVRSYSPAPVAHATMGIAKAFNSFYHDCPVIADGKPNPDRLALVRSAVQVLGLGLTLLAVDAPQEM